MKEENLIKTTSVLEGQPSTNFPTAKDSRDSLVKSSEFLILTHKCIRDHRKDVGVTCTVYSLHNSQFLDISSASASMQRASYFYQPVASGKICHRACN